MSRSCLVNILFALAIFFLPLLAAPSRILHPAPWIGFVSAATILVTQPPLGPRRMVRDRGDRFSGLGIFAGVIGAQVVAVTEFGYRTALRPAPLSVPVFAGGLLALGGLVLRVWSIRTLGRFFTSTVVVADDQRVIDNGPYRFVRHPSYAGSFATSLGVSICLASVAGLAANLLLALPSWLYRMRIEERALVATLGDAYRRYQRRTWRLIPLLY